MQSDRTHTYIYIHHGCKFIRLLPVLSIYMSGPYFSSPDPFSGLVVNEKEKSKKKRFFFLREKNHLDSGEIEFHYIYRKLGPLLTHCLVHSIDFG